MAKAAGTANTIRRQSAKYKMVVININIKL